MDFFNFGKKKETPCCGNSGKQDNRSACACGSCDAQGTRFLVLGACCQKSADTFRNVQQAVKELGLPDEVVNIGDALEIAKFGVMQTPALVVDNKVVSYGKLLKVEDVKKIFSKLDIK